MTAPRGAPATRPLRRGAGSPDAAAGKPCAVADPGTQRRRAPDPFDFGLATSSRGRLRPPSPLERGAGDRQALMEGMARLNVAAHAAYEATVAEVGATAPLRRRGEPG